MTKRIFFLVGFCFLLYSKALPQSPEPLDSFKKVLNKIRSFDSCYISAKKQNYVSPYTFSNQVKNDFLALTGTGSSATVGQYASLNLQPNNSQLTFSPFVYSGGDLNKHPFRNILSFDFTGSVSATSSLLDFKDWRTLNGSVSWTRLFSEGYHEDLEKPKLSNYQSIYDELHDEMVNQSEHPAVSLLRLNHPEFNNADDLGKAYRDSISKYEQLLTQDLWTSKHFWWFKLTGNVLSFDNTNYVVTGDASTYDNPKSKAIYTPSLNASMNYFIGFKKSGINLYFNLYTQIGKKDAFSEVYTASTYNSFHPLPSSDSSFIQKQNIQIFQTANENVATKWLPNFGGEFIFFAPKYKSTGFGLDLSFAHDDLISNKNTGANGYLTTTTVGLVISLNDNTGKATINIEPYFQFKDYFAETIPAMHLWGAKFSVPIGRLY